MAATVERRAPKRRRGRPVRADRAARPLTVDAATRRRRLPEQWPLIFALAGYPLSWALGVGALIWPAFALPMAGRMLVSRKTIRAPRGFGLWLLFLVWVMASIVSLDSKFPIAFMWRLSNYFSVTVFFLYVYNLPATQMSARRIVELLSNFWIMTVIGGWLGVLIPYGGFKSPMELVLGGSDVFLKELTHPKFAQVQVFLGYPLGRPAAPFVYTNTWGSVYALLIPFFFLAWLQSPDAARRQKAYLILAASLVPVFVSLNRGLWLSLLVALGYGATRPGEIGRLARRSMAAMAVIGLLLVTLTPIKGLVEDRSENQHSNAGRTFLYEETIKLTATSPIIGYGGPRPYGGDKLIPNLGTQGHLWLVMLSQGFVGLGLFLAFLFKMIWATRDGSVTTFWCHVLLVIAVVQLVVYDMFPVPIHLIFIAAALGLRSIAGDDVAVAEPATDAAVSA